MRFQETNGGVGVGWTSHAGLMKKFEVGAKNLHAAIHVIPTFSKWLPSSLHHLNARLGIALEPYSTVQYCVQTASASVPVPAY